jgi:acetyl esterase/lipase
MAHDNLTSDPNQAKPNAVLQSISTALGKLRADDDMFEVLTAFAELQPVAIEKSTVALARSNPTMADAVQRVLNKRGEISLPEVLIPDVTSRDSTIPGPAGSLPVRIYLPRDQSGVLPVIVYFHGGGWVIANKEVYDAGARSLSSKCKAIVVSVDYRQAPEHKFPAAWDDALAAYRWMTEHAASIGGDATRVALAGESAGGNLAVATAIAARDAGLPLPAHVLSVYPVAQTSLNTESYIENAIAVPLNRAMVEWFVKQLVRSDEDLKDRRLQLIEARLTGLPPVTIINARIDPLRSDGAKLEDALSDAGVAVERREYEGVTHEFFGCGAAVGKAREALDFAGRRLKLAFGTSEQASPVTGLS